MTIPEYHPLNPSGFENLHTIIVNLQIVRRTVDTLAVSPFVPDTPPGSISTPASPYAALHNARGKFERALSLPVQSMRDIASFSSYVAQAAPLVSDPKQLTTFLSAILETSWAIPDANSCTASFKV